MNQVKISEAPGILASGKDEIAKRPKLDFQSRKKLLAFLCSVLTLICLASFYLSIVPPSEEVTLIANMELGVTLLLLLVEWEHQVWQPMTLPKAPRNVSVVWFVQMSNVWTKGSYFSVCNYFYLFATVLFVPGERCEEVKTRVNNIKISRQGTGEARQRRFLKCHNSKSIRISWGALKRYLLDSEWWTSAFWQLWNWLKRL